MVAVDTELGHTELDSADSPTNSGLQAHLLAQSIPVSYRRDTHRPIGEVYYKSRPLHPLSRAGQRICYARSSNQQTKSAKRRKPCHAGEQGSIRAEPEDWPHKGRSSSTVDEAMILKAATCPVGGLRGISFPVFLRYDAKLTLQSQEARVSKK